MNLTRSEAMRIVAYTLLVMFGWAPICYLIALCMGWL